MVNCLRNGYTLSLQRKKKGWIIWHDWKKYFILKAWFFVPLYQSQTISIKKKSDSLGWVIGRIHLILVLFERDFAFIMRSYSISNLYLYIMKYFSPWTRKEGKVHLNGSLYLHLKTFFFFNSMTLGLLKLTKIHLHKNKVQGSRGNM